MGKRKTFSKRSVKKPPRGIPIRTKGNFDDAHNPFETAQNRHKRPKFEVNNRSNVNQRQQQSNAQQRPSKLLKALQKRQAEVRVSMKQSKKANLFLDKRIGEYDGTDQEQQTLARIVRERVRNSKRSTKFQLDDYDDDNYLDERLTHRGKAIDQIDHHVMLGDDEDDDDEIGNLNAIDTEMHFGGGGGKNHDHNIYGSSRMDLTTAYSQKKMDLDELILRRKIQKAEKLKQKEEQVDKFESMDEGFSDLAAMLSFRDKEKDIREHLEKKRAGTLSQEDMEFEEWDQEMRQFQFIERKVKATDRTKTPEEIAKEEAQRLHELETRRLARMHGDFDDDDFSDVESSDDDNNNRTLPKKKRKTHLTPEALDNDSDNEDTNVQPKVRFTADGLVRIDKHGNVIGKVGDSDSQQQEMFTRISDKSVYEVGTKVMASYRANEQYDGNESWFAGVVSEIHKDARNNVIRYDIEYDDGDFEENVEPRHVKILEQSFEENAKQAARNDEDIALKRKRQKAKEKARTEIPFVFEVPTTLEALHDMIGNYASTGNDVSLIIQRIHKANSVRLDKRNIAKMQNFYDVLIRRFVAVGDAIYDTGNGGEELARYSQLNELTKTLYEMAQESAEIAGAIWSRRIGIFQSAHAKRLRDASIGHGDEDAEDYTPWPSTGVVLALRALGHIFPVTDKRHHIVSPALLFLGQVISHTPIHSVRDLVVGTFCCGLVLEYTIEAKRIVPEASAFLASLLRLYSPDPKQLQLYPLPTFRAAVSLKSLQSLRKLSKIMDEADLKVESSEQTPSLCLEAEAIGRKEMSASLLFAALHFVEVSAQNFTGSGTNAEKEIFAEITESILALEPKAKTDPLPRLLQEKVLSAVVALEAVSSLQEGRRFPLQRRAGPSKAEAALPTMAPRYEKPEHSSSVSRRCPMNPTQAEAERARREYRREHKAVARDLRTDNAIVESERRREQKQKNTAEKERRHKAFAWLEQEQAVMNQQVRQGGGLLQGGGTGAAKAKARSGKLGIKKGGKF